MVLVLLMVFPNVSTFWDTRATLPRNGGSLARFDQLGLVEENGVTRAMTTTELETKLEDSETLVSRLKGTIEAKEGEQSENDVVLAAKNAEISLLEARVEKAYLELEEERRLLGGQVDELRRAGQVSASLSSNFFLLID